MKQSDLTQKLLRKNPNGAGDKRSVKSKVPQVPVGLALDHLAAERRTSVSETIAVELLNHGSPRLRQLLRQYAKTGARAK